MCDLHLSDDQNTLQYDVLKWATNDILKNSPDIVAFVGDVTCDGNKEVYDYFIYEIENTKIPFLFVPGNSDLRHPLFRESIREKASVCKNEICGIKIFAVNDCDRNISDLQFKELDDADEKSIVFMHHPLGRHNDATNEKFANWRKTHEKTLVVCGHLHKEQINENYILLGAMDPDKSVGETPCLTYYDTDARLIEKSNYDAPVPEDIFDYFGISCYKVIDEIKFATENKLKYLELRPNCADYEDFEEIKSHIDLWRKSGGENLSLHLSDVGWSDGKLIVSEKYEKLIEIAKTLKVDRLTQHVPKASVKDVKENPKVLDEISSYIAKKYNEISHDVVIGIENMHMTKNDKADDTRRFGYLPYECMDFMNLVKEKTNHKVGINFDIGHARNNVPYSQKYQIGTWLSIVGKYIVGYHIHQVYSKDGIVKNHTAIFDVYGHLISFASFFKMWELERINKAPVIFEMREEGAYKITLETFNEHKK